MYRHVDGVTGTTTTRARSLPSSKRSARRSSSQRRVSSDGELLRRLRVPLPSHRRDVLTGERRRWRRDGGMGTHARAAGAGRGGAHSTSSTSALDGGRAASSNFAFDVAAGACVLLLRDVPQRAAEVSFTPARRPLRSSWIARRGHLKMADPTHGRARQHTRAVSSRPMAWEAFGSSCRRPELVRRARGGLGACPTPRAPGARRRDALTCPS